MESFLENYLDRLEELHRDTIRAFDGLPQSALDWSPGEDVPSICALVNHMTGAERYWIGDVAGGVPSDRNRDAEFRAHGESPAILRKRIQDVQEFEKNLLSKVTLHDLEKVCVSPRTGRRFDVGWALLHALEHTALHLGHIQIISQLWKQQHESAAS
jgi:uncharacterized damage-inducible protein DinB